MSDATPADLSTRAGVEQLFSSWWQRAQGAVKAGFDLRPEVVHIVRSDPKTGALLEHPGLVSQMGHDPLGVRQLALRYGSIGLGMTYPSRDSVAFVLEHPEGDRAWFGLITAEGLSEPFEMPEVLHQRPRVLDAIGRTLQ